MTTFLLIRHASCAHVERAIAGRMPGVHLDAAGREQARELGRALADEALDAVVTSPLERARETAAEIATATGLAPTVDERLTELDYGDWTGRTLEELGADPRWRPFNVARSTSRIPGGELALEAQARALAALTALRDEYRDGRVAVVSHADVIRGVLVHCLGMPLDLSLRLEIEPASVSTVTIGDDWVTVHAVNSTTSRFACSRS